MRGQVRQQIAFYASTPAYRTVLDVHGWDFGPRLTALSKRGRWETMADVITDDVISEIAVEAPIDELGGAVRRRYEGLLDRIGFYTVGRGPTSITDDQMSRIVSAAKGG